MLVGAYFYLPKCTVVTILDLSYVAALSLLKSKGSFRPDAVLCGATRLLRAAPHVDAFTSDASRCIALRHRIYGAARHRTQCTASVMKEP